jgi:hypothetical protein
MCKTIQLTGISMFIIITTAAAAADENKPNRPTWAVGALFRGAGRILASS